jgi:hypothetical protein
VIYKDADGKVVYDNHVSAHVVDVAARKLVAYRPPSWLPMGHGFERTSTPTFWEEQVFRHKGSEIGRWKGSLRACTTAGYVSVNCRTDVGETVPRPEVKVWSQSTRKWVTLDKGMPEAVAWIY